jgi:hypothetical protein
MTAAAAFVRRVLQLLLTPPPPPIAAAAGGPPASIPWRHLLLLLLLLLPSFSNPFCLSLWGIGLIGVKELQHALVCDGRILLTHDLKSHQITHRGFDAPTRSGSKIESMDPFECERQSMQIQAIQPHRSVNRSAAHFTDSQQQLDAGFGGCSSSSSSSSSTGLSPLSSFPTVTEPLRGREEFEPLNARIAPNQWLESGAPQHSVHFRATNLGVVWRSTFDEFVFFLLAVLSLPELQPFCGLLLPFLIVPRPPAPIWTPVALAIGHPAIVSGGGGVGAGCF